MPDFYIGYTPPVGKPKTEREISGVYMVSRCHGNVFQINEAIT